jgi:hypothetical protein
MLEAGVEVDVDVLEGEFGGEGGFVSGTGIAGAIEIEDRSGAGYQGMRESES